LYGGDNNNQNSSGPGEGVAAEVKQSLFTLWTADLMLEREDARTHTLHARLVGEKRAGHGRAGRGLEARIRYYYYCGIRALATTHLGGLSEVKARLAVSCRVSLFVGYLVCHSMFAYTDSVAKSLYKHALTVNAHTACKYFTNISIGSAVPSCTLTQTIRTGQPYS
jgi:hypothetical protein